MPERLIEGNSLNELKNLPQIFSGISLNCLKQIKNFASRYFDKIIEANSTEEAEIIKLASNSFRDLNFSFANEISRICENYNLSANELIEKANYGYSRNNISYPSVGVGGFCLPKDPYIFSNLINNKEGYKFSLLSRKINDESINQAMRKLNKIKKDIFNKRKKIKILILGVAFKGLPETIDLRNSSSLILYEKLKKKNYVKLYDINGHIIKKYFKFNQITLNPNLNSYDLVIIINNHAHYKDLFCKNIKLNKKNKLKVLFDPWNIVEKKICDDLNWVHKKI